MILFPNCKINIGLNIVGRRSDGYHDLETIFYPVRKLHDAVEILPQPASDNKEETVLPRFSGLPVEGAIENNLCVKAYRLLKQNFPELPPIQLCLHKAIPMGAGLGGGSADGAFTLLLLNQKFHLKLLTSQLLDYALRLGSDCPFFIINHPCFAEGRGEILQPVPLDLSGYSLVLIHPGIHVSTAQAFAGITPQRPVSDLQELITRPIESWKETVVNDFEKTVFRQHPLLAEIKEKLYETGALYASMSGSGSSLYGIYPKENLPAKKLYPKLFEQQLEL